MLNAAEIIAEAETRAGVPDSEPVFRPNLDQLVASLNSDNELSALGESSVCKGLVDRTVHRLEGLKWRRDHPEIADEAIAEPVFLTGLPRSGTTYFQYLFDKDPRFRLIRTWESITPSPPPGYDPESVRRRKAEEEQRRREAVPKKIEGFEALHLLDLDGPDECHVFLEQTYAAAGYQNLYDVPTYFDYMMKSLDFAATYEVHKRQLQLLQWRMKQPRWAVKYPNHVLAMDKIVAVHPTARFVMTHRDPVQTLASISKMTLTLRGTRYEQPIDPNRVGRQMLDFVQRHIDRIMAFCTSSGSDRMTHVDYYRIVDNPAACMAEVHSGLGIDTPDEVREAVADWRRRNPKGARGANPYALEQFGLDADAVAGQFQDYMRHFDIPRERDGLARAGT
ncbi:MAG: sulfotransferase family protein [Rhizomicrobium sp.]